MNTITKIAVTAGITAAVALGGAGAAGAAPSGSTSAADTVRNLEAEGFKVILNKIGDAPLSACAVSGIRPGREVTQRKTDSGGDSIDTVLYRTVYVDLRC